MSAALVEHSEEVQINPATPLILKDLPDAEVVGYREAIGDEISRMIEDLKKVRVGIDAEIERRINAAGGTKLPVPGYTVELVDEYSQWAYDIDKLRAAADLLDENDRAKIVKHVPEMVVVEHEHYEPGAPQSMTALAKNFGEGSAFTKALAEARTRSHLGKKVVVKKAGGAK